MVHLAQLLRRRDPERPHEVRHVLFIGAVRAGAFLAGKPDLLLRDRQASRLASWPGRAECASGADSVMPAPSIAWERDKLGYHVLPLVALPGLWNNQPFKRPLQSSRRR